MTGVNYVPSDRTLRTAWATVAGVLLLVLVGLTVAVIATAADLERTNERLNETQEARDRMQQQMRNPGVLLSFEDGAPDGVGTTTFRCKRTERDAYVCRPEQ